MENSLQSHNYEVIASLYKNCYENLKHYIMGYTHDSMAAEDMIQDLFIKVMSFDVITNDTARSLIFVMAKRMIVDDARHKSFIRQQEKNLRQSLSLYDDFSVSKKIAHDELAVMETKVLNSMAPKRAEVYKMYRHDELTAQEIADKLNLSKRTVETHIYLSTKQMREQLRKAL